MTHHILPGSFELNDGVITVGVHTGPSEWQAQNLKYVRLDINKVEDKTQAWTTAVFNEYDKGNTL